MKRPGLIHVGNQSGAISGENSGERSPDSVLYGVPKSGVSRMPLMNRYVAQIVNTVP
jgi:hypothetical protein